MTFTRPPPTTSNLPANSEGNPFARLNKNPSASSSSSGHATPSTEAGLGHASEVSAHLDAYFTRAESSARPPRAAQDIEMDTISPGGHRRRRSSVMNTASGSQLSKRAPSAHSQNRGEGRGKILEEEGETSSYSGEQTDDDFSDDDLQVDEEMGLTTRERRRKTKKRRRNQQLDNRIIHEDIMKEERKDADKSVVRRSMINVSLILLWYLFSLSISLYNKWMFDSKKLNFSFPLFITSTHMLVQFTLSCIVLYFVPSLRPTAGRNLDNGQSRLEGEPKRPLMTKFFYLTRIGPCGVATGLDIGLGNTSLQFITLTFYTMCKSSALGFVLLFAFLFRLEKPTWKLVGIIATMTGGVVMMVFGEVEFVLSGFVLVISAAFFSGFRWGLTQILLLRNPATSNPFSSIFFLAPVMFVTLVSIAIPMEGFGNLIAAVVLLEKEWGVFLTPVLVLFPGTIAFLMTASEFALLQRTSVVTLSIAGIFKEVVTISTATLVFGDKLTLINISGLVVTITAISAYNYIKITKMREEAIQSVHKAHHVEDGGVAGGVSSPSNGDSDAENEAEGEDDGLLRKNLKTSHVTADGDIIPRPEPSPTREGRSERED